MSLERRTVAKFMAACIDVATANLPRDVFEEIGAEIAGVTSLGAEVTISLTDGRIVKFTVDFIER